MSRLSASNESDVHDRQRSPASSPTLHAREGGRSGTRVGPWVRLVPLVALWAVPVLAVAVAAPAADKREAASVAPPLPSVVTVGSQSTDYRTSVTVSVEVKRGGQVRSPVSGLITSIAETDGPVRSGQELFAVDGVPVLAQPGTVPFHRELRWGDEGEDVEGLGRFLVGAGLLDEELADDTFGPAVRAAVVGLQERLGVRTDGVFRPSYVAYVPQSAPALGEPLLAVGSTVATGEAVLDTAPVPAQMRFLPASTGDSLANLRGAPLMLTLGDLQISVSGLDPAPEELGAIHTALREAVANGDAQVTGDSGGPGEPGQYGGGLLSLAEPQVRGVVPGTAVYVTGSGAQCLFKERANGDWTAVSVPALDPAVGMLGSVYVDPAVIDARIARDPLVLPDDVLAECR